MVLPPRPTSMDAFKLLHVAANTCTVCCCQTHRVAFIHSLQGGSIILRLRQVLCRSLPSSLPRGCGCHLSPIVSYHLLLTSPRNFQKTSSSLFFWGGLGDARCRCPWRRHHAWPLIVLIINGQARCVSMGVYRRHS